MAQIPQNFLDAVVAIGVNKDDGSTSWIGTGFIYGKFIKEDTAQRKNYSIFLITNKHVLNGLTSIVVKFNSFGNQPAINIQLDLNDSNGQALWGTHTNPEIDIGVLHLNVKNLDIIKKQISINFFCSEQHIFTKNAMQQNGITEGDFIYVLGFPMGIVATDRQYVILRSGAIARIRDLYEERSTDFIVDAFVFPGNSGGPVISKPELTGIQGTKVNNISALIGIITSYIPYTDIAISPQTKKPRITFEKNSGLSIVLPVDYIIETIDLYHENKKIDIT